MDSTQTKTQNSPNLVVVSSGPETERRRTPRLNLGKEQFRLRQNGKIFSVSDLSSEGMALRILDPQDRILFPMGSEVDGLLNIHAEKHPVKARVRRITADTVGLEFETLDASTAEAFAKFLDPAVLGAELRPLPTEGTMLWYHGPSGTDLLLRRSADGQFYRITLYVMSSFVQWDAAEGLTTGRAQCAREQSEVRGIVRFETLLLDADPAPDAGKLRIAKTLVLSSNLPQDLKKWCARRLEAGDGDSDS